MGEMDDKPHLSATNSQSDAEKAGSVEAIRLDSNGVIKKDIGAFQIIAVGFNIPNSWLAIAVALTVALSAGGMAELVYGTILTSILYLFIAVTLAELASVYPTAGGQYHFTSTLAPKSLSRGLSYACGMMATVSWVVCAASVCTMVATIFSSLGNFYNGFVPAPWMIFLIFQAVNVFSLVFNLFALKRMNWIHDVFFVLSISTFIVICITCLARGDKQGDRGVWASFRETTGWTPGVSFLTGLSTPSYMFGGLDGALHLAEETLNAHIAVPRALMAVITIGSVTAILFAIAMAYCITDFDSLTGEMMPFYKLLREATKSDAAGLVFMIIVVMISIFIVIAVHQTTSRLIWALARDDGLLFSKLFSRISPTLGVPHHALWLSSFFIFICGCIGLGSTTAFNALLNSFLIMQTTSFAIPAALLMWRRRGPDVLPKDRSFVVPEWIGWTCNIGTVVTAILQIIFFDFPTVLPVTGSNMNYACVVLTVIAILSIINWYLHARKHYHGPRLEFYT